MRHYWVKTRKCMVTDRVTIKKYNIIKTNINYLYVMLLYKTG